MVFLPRQVPHVTLGPKVLGVGVKLEDLKEKICGRDVVQITGMDFSRWGEKKSWKTNETLTSETVGFRSSVNSLNN